MMFFSIAILVATILGIHLWWRLRRPVGMPPGPFGMPFVGYLFSLKPRPQTIYLENGLKYGNTFTIPMGLKHLVVLNGWREIKEALMQEDISLSRFHFHTSLTAKGEPDVFVPSVHKIMRRFALQHLRNLGLGKPSMEQFIIDGMDEMLDSLGADCDRKFSIENNLLILILNTLWKLVADQTYSIDDKRIIGLANELNASIVGLLQDTAAIIYPCLKKFSGGVVNNYQIIREQLFVLLNKTVDEHIATYDEQNLRDYIDIYLSETYKEQTTEHHNMAFQKTRLLEQVVGLFHAGSVSTLLTVKRVLVFTVIWPKIQEKIQEEVDRVVGRNRRPSYSDMAALPYVKAVILESHRYGGSIFILRHVLKTTKFAGYKVPKGCFVIRNLSAVYRDPHLWGDPDVFRPERFIDANGEVSKPEYLIPFSLGPRSCIGESLAKMEVFLILTSIWQNFSYGFPADETPPIETLVDSITNIFSSIVFRKR